MNDKKWYFQETKRIVVAEIQHITFNEFLPILLGKEIMDKHDLTAKKLVRLIFCFYDFWTSCNVHTKF